MVLKHIGIRLISKTELKLKIRIFFLLGARGKEIGHGIFVYVTVIVRRQRIVGAFYLKERGNVSTVVVFFLFLFFFFIMSNC